MNHLSSEKKIQSRFCIFFICLTFNLSIYPQTFVNIESGVLFTGLNNIRNGTNGTLFSLKNDLSTSPSIFLRIRAGFLLNNKHYFSILYAPLKSLATGAIDRNILFDEKNFKANTPLEAVYKFNSYRLTYNQRIINNNNFKFGLGLSAKIRDAGTTLKNKELLSENFSTGFAPLINVLSSWNISQKAVVNFLGEGIIASKGRAIDLSLSGRYSFTKSLKGNIGYRLLEGGADGTNRYNFIRFHFIFAGLNFSFKKKVNRTKIARGYIDTPEDKKLYISELTEKDLPIFID